MTEEHALRNAAGRAGPRRPGDDTIDTSLEEAIALNARALRRQSGLSVAEMAERVGISKAMLSKIENHQTSCSLSTLGRLADGLRVPVTDLLRGADAARRSLPRAEMVYVLEGVLDVHHGATVTRLRAGETLQLPAGMSVTPEPVERPVRFLSVVSYPEA